jgi:hypothetical protein
VHSEEASAEVPSRDSNSVCGCATDRAAMNQEQSYVLTRTELRRALLSYASTNRTAPNPTELRRTLLSYAAPYLATPHPIELRRTPQFSSAC